MRDLTKREHTFNAENVCVRCGQDGYSSNFDSPCEVAPKTRRQRLQAEPAVQLLIRVTASTLQPQNETDEKVLDAIRRYLDE